MVEFADRCDWWHFTGNFGCCCWRWWWWWCGAVWWTCWCVRGCWCCCSPSLSPSMGGGNWTNETALRVWIDRLMAKVAACLRVNELWRWKPFDGGLGLSIVSSSLRMSSSLCRSSASTFSTDAIFLVVLLSGSNVMGFLMMPWRGGISFGTGVGPVTRETEDERDAAGIVTDVCEMIGFCRVVVIDFSFWLLSSTVDVVWVTVTSWSLLTPEDELSPSSLVGLLVWLRLVFLAQQIVGIEWRRFSFLPFNFATIRAFFSEPFSF